MGEALALLRARVRDVPDFPKPGVMFKDITPLLGDEVAFSTAIDLVVTALGRGSVDKVVGIEARGFIVAAPVAYHMAAGFVPVRKAGKLPWKTVAGSYTLEYGEETIEVHEDAIEPGERVAIVDDVLATGGTAEATARLIEGLGARVTAFGFLMELDFLKGRDRLAAYPIHSLLRY
ncbi:MAG TPA: adenine phosphoribosyltransferase [Actinomycetota bacterium]|nr:adenine phosphoribosyltransferase [Actinomycetota bacterium]